METHLKRFFIEVYNNSKMYDEYLKGEVYIDQNIYYKWLLDIKKRNELFAETLNEFNRIKCRETIIESRLNNEYCVSEYFNNPVISDISEFGKFKIQQKKLGNSNGHYICNGYFKETLEQIYKVLDNGSFSVGICTEKKTSLFKDVVTHYNMLKDFLLKEGYQTSCIQTNVKSNNRVYLLMYDHKNKKR